MNRRNCNKIGIRNQSPQRQFIGKYRNPTQKRSAIPKNVRLTKRINLDSELPRNTQFARAIQSVPT